MTARRLLQDRDAPVTIGGSVAVALVMALTIAVAEEEGATRDPDALAYALGALVGLLLLARRRWPLGVLIASIGVLMVYYALDYPGYSPAVPLAAAAYLAALTGHAPAAAVLLGGFIAFGVAWQTLGEDTEPGTVIASGALTDAALLAAVLLLGETVRSRRALAAEVSTRLRRVEQDRRREAEARIQQERLHTARELHDVVAHTVSSLNVQAGLAADVLDDDPDRAKDALRMVRAQAREAIGELSATIGLLRDRSGADGERAPAPGLVDVDGLVRTAAAAGVETRVEVTGAARPLPGAVDLTAYRIVQESLTNVLRHADAGHAEVLVRYEPDALVVRVDDDGRSCNGGGVSDGFGLRGMRERSQALGGRLDAGPRPGGGFRVDARLPLPRETE